LAQFDFVPSYARDLVGWDAWPVPVPAAAAGAMADVAGAPLRTQAEADALTLSLEDRATRALRIALRSGTMGCEWRCEDMGCGGEDTGGGSAAGESGCGSEASICLVDATAVIDALAARLGSSHLAVATARVPPDAQLMDDFGRHLRHGAVWPRRRRCNSPRRRRPTEKSLSSIRPLVRGGREGLRLRGSRASILGCRDQLGRGEGLSKSLRRSHQL
jgi:hypothetical protein